MRGHIAIRETCVAGRTIERIIKMPNGNHKGRRSGVKAPSTEEIKKYMRYEERPPLITGIGTKRVEYEAEIKILVNGDRSL